MIQTYIFFPIDSRMYVVLENNRALIVDPCISGDALSFLKDNNISEITVILSHEHYDHISGVNWLREQFKDVYVLCSSECGEAIESSRMNLSDFWEVLFVGKDEETKEYVRNMNIQSYSCKADETFDNDYEFMWEGHKIILKETPGHSQGSICILFDDDKMFSGDTLVTGFSTITRLPGGSKKMFNEVTVPFLQSLDKNIMVYPGHGDAQLLCEFDLFK